MQQSAAAPTNTPTRNWLLSQAAIAAQIELDNRAAARTGLLAFTQFTMPTYRVGRHHRLICDKLEAVERGEIKRLMIQAPPRSGKSELVSKRFPAWFLGRNPDKQIISASYGADLASDFGRDVRNIIADKPFNALFPGMTLAEDSKSKSRWHTNKGGSYVAAGVGTAITGRGSDILNLDDLVANREEADSEKTRKSVWDWFTSTAYTRLMPGGAIVLTMTRWHEDDVAGRLLAEMEAGADQWEVVSLPAINDAGEALWPEAYDLDALRRIERQIGPRDWNALYQQQPRPTEGSLFKVAQISVLDAAPAGAAPVRAWDIAATAQTGTRDPDWTAGVQMLRTADGRFVVTDVTRLRGGPDEVMAAVKNTAALDGKSVRISFPQDPGAAGKALALFMTRELAGYTVETSTETGAKETRAAPVVSQCNVGNLSIVRAPWNRAFLDELAAFPSGTHDDQVDALSRAFTMVATERGVWNYSSSDMDFARRGARRW